MPLQTAPAENGGTSFKFSQTMAPFDLPACPSPDPHALCKVLVNNLVEGLATTAEQRSAIYSDAMLSGPGQDAKFDPIGRGHNLSIARVADQVELLESAANREEVQMLGVTPLDRTDSVGAIESREVRDYLARLPLEDALRAIDTGGDELLLAVKRSPVPMSDPLVQRANDVWAKNRRAANPEKSMQIDSDRATCEWAKRCLSVVAGVSLIATGTNREGMLRAILEEGSGGFAPFGISKHDAAAAEFRLKHDPTFKKKGG